MDPKSRLPQNQDQKKFVQDEEKENWGERGFEQGGGQGSGSSNYEPREENVSHRGYEEDQPGKPVRGTGSMREDQDTDTRDETDKIY